MESRSPSPTSEPHPGESRGSQFRGPAFRRACLSLTSVILHGDESEEATLPFPGKSWDTCQHATTKSWLTDLAQRGSALGHRTTNELQESVGTPSTVYSLRKQQHLPHARGAVFKQSKLL